MSVINGLGDCPRRIFRDVQMESRSVTCKVKGYYLAPPTWCNPDEIRFRIDGLMAKEETRHHRHPCSTMPDIPARSAI